MRSLPRPVPTFPQTAIVARPGGASMHRPNIAQSTSLEVTKKRGFESNPPRSDPRRSEAQTQRRTPAIQTSWPRRCQNNRLAATSPTCERLGRPHLALYNSARRPALLSSPRLRLVLLLHPPALPLSSFPRTKRTRLPRPQGLKLGVHNFHSRRRHRLLPVRLKFSESTSPQSTEWPQVPPSKVPATASSTARSTPRAALRISVLPVH